jgi:hypothetical protein
VDEIMCTHISKCKNDLKKKLLQELGEGRWEEQWRGGVHV